MVDLVSSLKLSAASSNCVASCTRKPKFSLDMFLNEALLTKALMFCYVLSRLRVEAGNRVSGVDGAFIIPALEKLTHLQSFTCA